MQKVESKQKNVADGVISYECEKRSARCEVLTVRQNIRKWALETEEAPQQILGREMQSIGRGAAIQMVPVRHIRRQVRRVHQEAGSITCYSNNRSSNN